MDYSDYKKITTSTGVLKKKAEKFRKLSISAKKIEEHNKQFMYGFYMFCGMILFGILKFYFFGEEEKKVKGVKKNIPALISIL